MSLRQVFTDRGSYIFLYTAVHLNEMAVFYIEIHSYLLQYIWRKMLPFILISILTYCSTFEWNAVFHTEIHSYKVQYIGMKTLSFILMYILTYCSTFEWKRCLSYRNTFYIQIWDSHGIILFPIEGSSLIWVHIFCNIGNPSTNG